jgi:hypothetical protein
MVGGGSTVKLIPLLTTPFSVTVTLPVVAPEGTGATMLVALQFVGVAVVPLKLTVLLPWVVPKLVPAMVTAPFTDAEFGVRLVMFGVGSTVKLVPLLATPLTVIMMLPVAAPEGTGTTTLVALQLVGTAAVPLKLTVLPFWLVPKLVPAIVTAVPTAAEFGETPLMLGVGSTVKLTPPLATPLTVTRTFPVVAPAGTGATMLVAPQLVGVTVVPLKLTVLLP